MSLLSVSGLRLTRRGKTILDGLDLVMEIVRDQAVASAIPEVRVTHSQAKVPHEAATGSVDSRQLETRMARGLAPDEAVDLIVRGMLA